MLDDVIKIAICSKCKIKGETVFFKTNKKGLVYKTCLTCLNKPKIKIHTVKIYI